MRGLLGVWWDVVERVVTLPVDREWILEYEDMALPGLLGPMRVARGASSSESESDCTVRASVVARLVLEGWDLNWGDRGLSMGGPWEIMMRNLMTEKDGNSLSFELEATMMLALLAAAVGDRALVETLARGLIPIPRVG